jgi:hypothetical protein
MRQKYAIALVILVLLFSLEACSWIQQNPELTAEAIRIVARRGMARVFEQFPNLVDEVCPWVDDIAAIMRGADVADATSKHQVIDGLKEIIGDNQDIEDAIHLMETYYDETATNRKNYKLLLAFVLGVQDACRATMD